MRNQLILIILAAVAGPAAAQRADGEASHRHSPDGELERRVWMMGTVLTAQVAGNRAVAAAATEAAFAAVQDIDGLLSTWIAESEISGFNHSPIGTPVALSPALDALLSPAFLLADSTGRAFDPTVGPLDDAWDLRGAGRIPDLSALRDALAATGAEGVTDGGGVLIRRHPAAWIDTDGFGKGAALRAAATALAAHGVTSALLNFGGQVLAIGSAADGDAWEIPVADPRDRGRPAATLRLRDRSASTSSQSERGVLVAGTWYGHVLDPRSGRPVPPWGSVTVVHADPLSADALSTALFVMGPDHGLPWAEAHGVAALFLIDTPAGLIARTTTGLAGLVAGTLP
jgi:thiamine biosynthesis lipoprotein